MFAAIWFSENYQTFYTESHPDWTDIDRGKSLPMLQWSIVALLCVTVFLWPVREFWVAHWNHEEEERKKRAKEAAEKKKKAEKEKVEEKKREEEEKKKEKEKELLKKAQEAKKKKEKEDELKRIAEKTKAEEEKKKEDKSVERNGTVTVEIPPAFGYTTNSDNNNNIGIIDDPPLVAPPAYEYIDYYSPSENDTHSAVSVLKKYIWNLIAAKKAAKFLHNKVSDYSMERQEEEERKKRDIEEMNKVLEARKKEMENRGMMK